MSAEVKCPVCGFGNKSAAVICDDCGLMIPQFHACSHCGFMNTSDSRFCGECGSNLADSEAAAALAGPVAAPQFLAPLPFAPAPAPIGSGNLPPLPASVPVPPPTPATAGIDPLVGKGTAPWNGPTFKLVHEGTGVELRLPWRDGPLLLGRPGGDPDIDLSGFPEASVISRKHARILVSGNTLEIEDLGSANGTYVNNGRLSQLRVLVDGDRIAFGQGSKVVFTVRLSG